MTKDTAKSDCGTSQFVIVVCFKCFCKNVVNSPTLLRSLGALAWYKYSAHSVGFQLQIKCSLVSVFFLLFLEPGGVSCSSGQCTLITVCSLT